MLSIFSIEFFFIFFLISQACDLATMWPFGSATYLIGYHDAFAIAGAATGEELLLSAQLRVGREGRHGQIGHWAGHYTGVVLLRLTR